MFARPLELEKIKNLVTSSLRKELEALLSSLLVNTVADAKNGGSLTVATENKRFSSHF